jgi:peptidoglycan/LPS O-acetylase OafA/YrhL
MKPHIGIETASNYRADIDGLRAIAVLAVVGYHYIAQYFRGGFIGVDIFFVISGYLLSGIILSEVQAGTFSFSRFYERRIRRIFPALFVLLAFCTVFACFFLLPQDNLLYSRSMLASALSSSNFYFYLTSNYFDAPSADLPLLHTWSLAVEEQFYLLFPIFIVLLWLYARKYLRFAVFVVAIASFAWGVIDVRINPGAAFYLPFTRAWELMAGALLTLRVFPVPHSRFLRESLAAIGLIGILLLIAVLPSSVPFPGEWSLLPCAGAGAIILAGQERQTFVGRALSLKPLVFVGLISYSLYLWHWPLLVFSKIAILPMAGSYSSKIMIPLLFVLSILISTFSYRFVETPFRKGPRRPGKPAVFVFGASCVFASSAFGLIIASSPGFMNRFSPSVISVANYLNYKTSHSAELKTAFQNGSCFLDRREAVSDFDESRCFSFIPGKQQVLLFGDSHAANLRYGLENSFPEFHFYQATSSSCPPTLQQGNTKTAECKQFVDKVLNEFIPRYSVKTVLMNASWTSSDLQYLTGTIALLQQRGIEVIVLGPLPVYRSALPRLLATSIQNGDPGYAQRQFLHATLAIDATMSRMARETWHVSYISLLDVLCPGGPCVEYAASGVPLQFDMAHLTLQGSDFVGRELRRHFPDLMEEKHLIAKP